MNKLLLSVMMLGLLTGCASQSAMEQPKAAAEEKPVATQGNTTGAAAGSSLAANPLRDPSSVLAKRSVYYGFESSVVKDEYKPLVETHAKYVAAHPDAKVIVQGNTDERGSREYNIGLGTRRAESVAKMMKVLGVSDRQLETVSFGEEKPKAHCHDESCWKENRRSDIVYQGE